MSFQEKKIGDCFPSTHHSPGRLSKNRDKMECDLQGWAPRPVGNPPRGEGGFPAPPRTVGRGGFPAPTRPVKMIKTAGKLRGKIKARN